MRLEQRARPPSADWPGNAAEWLAGEICAQLKQARAAKVGFEAAARVFRAHAIDLCMQRAGWHP
jgi:hypothetical protein